MRINSAEETELTIENESIENVEDFIYLGHKLSIYGQDKKITRRISLAWNTFNRYGYLFRSAVNMEEKKKLWNMCVLPSLIYASETWIMDAKTIKRKRLRVTVRSMERAMTGISKRERKEYINKITGIKDRKNYNTKKVELGGTYHKMQRQ